MKTQAQLRAAFWESFPKFVRRAGWRQNRYGADIRMAWVDFIDSMRRDRQISETLASRATL